MIEKNVFGYIVALKFYGMVQFNHAVSIINLKIIVSEILILNNSLLFGIMKNLKQLENISNLEHKIT